MPVLTAVALRTPDVAHPVTTPASVPSISNSIGHRTLEPGTARKYRHSADVVTNDYSAGGRAATRRDDANPLILRDFRKPTDFRDLRLCAFTMAFDIRGPSPV